MVAGKGIALTTTIDNCCIINTHFLPRMERTLDLKEKKTVMQVNLILQYEIEPYYNAENVNFTRKLVGFS